MPKAKTEKKEKTEKKAVLEKVPGEFEVLDEIAGCPPGFTVGEVFQKGKTNVCRATFLTGPKTGQEILIHMEAMKKI